MQEEHRSNRAGDDVGQNQKKGKNLIKFVPARSGTKKKNAKNSGKEKSRDRGKSRRTRQKNTVLRRKKLAPGRMAQENAGHASGTWAKKGTKIPSERGSGGVGTATRTGKGRKKRSRPSRPKQKPGAGKKAQQKRPEGRTAANGRAKRSDRIRHV